MRLRGSTTKYIRADFRRCKACWDCLDECKWDVLGKVDVWFHKHVVIKNAEDCRGCQKCIAVCPNKVFEAISEATGRAACAGR